jgi:DNA-binding LacI/PurR family transcriptional regulator
VIERLRGLARVVDGADHQLVLFAVERPEQRAACFSALAGGGSVDGVVSVSLGLEPDEAERFEAARVPVVLVDHEDPRLPCLTIDDVAGGRMATEHLLALGHRRIAFIGDEERNAYGFTSSARRRMGYEAALRDAGIPPERRLAACSGPGRVAAGRATLRLLADDAPPTAIFAASDEQALGVLDAAAEADIAVPGELSVVGFDDVEVARWADLTTVCQPLEESGARGAEMVLDAIAGIPIRSRRMRLELVRRATSAEPG